MPQDGDVTSSPPHARPPLARSSADAVVGGVCAGLGEFLGMPAVAVRAAAVLLTVFGGGLGVAIYLVLWAVLPVSAAPAVIAESVEERRQPRFSVFHWLVLGGIVLVTGGISLASDAGSWFTDARYAVPALAIAAGAFVAWYQLDDPTGRRRGRTRARWVGVVQVVVGVALAMVGVVVIVTQGQGTRGVVNGALAGAAVLAGAVVIAAPFALRLYRGLQREQAERVRATERADIAAHLHDSVLQTLALIQRRADDPTVVAGLARRQERELRAWLYGGESRESNSLAAAVAAEIHEVEDEHGVPVEIVVTGDRTMEEAGDALVKATREAVLNAVRHGRPPVSVFMEVGPSGVEVFVRDHGDGFEMSDIGDDRLGVRESIIGRMKRAEGTARIRRLENGTEVSLTLPPPAHAEPELEPEPEPEPEPETPPEFAPAPAPPTEPDDLAVESEDPATPEPAVTPQATARHTRAASASTKENPR